MNGVGASPLLRTTFGLFDAIISKATGYEKQTAQLFFAHDVTVGPLLNLLGFYPGPVYSNMTKSERRDRTFRYSKVTPFATNVAFTLWECPAKDKDDRLEYRVSIMHDEKQMKFPYEPCKGKIYCRLDDVKDSYQSQLSLDYTGLCDLPFNGFTVPIEQSLPNSQLQRRSKRSLDHLPGHLQKLLKSHDPRDSLN
jgi:hypothetical protein